MALDKRLIERGQRIALREMVSFTRGEYELLGKVDGMKRDPRVNAIDYSEFSKLSEDNTVQVYFEENMEMGEFISFLQKYGINRKPTQASSDEMIVESRHFDFHILFSPVVPDSSPQ